MRFFDLTPFIPLSLKSAGEEYQKERLCLSLTLLGHSLR